MGISWDRSNRYITKGSTTFLAKVQIQFHRGLCLWILFLKNGVVLANNVAPMVCYGAHHFSYPIRRCIEDLRESKRKQGRGYRHAEESFSSCRNPSSEHAILNE